MEFSGSTIFSVAALNPTYNPYDEKNNRKFLKSYTFDDGVVWVKGDARVSQLRPHNKLILAGGLGTEIAAVLNPKLEAGK